MASSTLGKDFQDQQRSIIDWKIQMPFEIALLRWTQGLVKQHFHRLMHLRKQPDLVRLATAYKQGGIRGFPLAGDSRHGIQSRCLRKQTQLFQLSVEMEQTKINANQDDRRLRRVRRIV